MAENAASGGSLPPEGQSSPDLVLIRPSTCTEKKELSLEKLLDIAINEKNSVNFIFLKNVIFALLKHLKLENLQVSYNSDQDNSFFDASLIESKMNVQRSSGDVNDLITESFIQSRTNIGAEPGSRRSSIIGDSLKLQQAEHKIDGHDKDIKSIFDVLDQVSVTAKEGEIRSNDIQNVQNDLVEKVTDQEDKIEVLRESVTEVKGEMERLEETVSSRLSTNLQPGSGLGSVQWDVLSSTIKYDRTKEDKNTISTRIEEDEQIKDFVAAVDSTFDKFVVREDLHTKMADLEDKTDKKFNQLIDERLLALETRTRLSEKELGESLSSKQLVDPEFEKRITDMTNANINDVNSRIAQIEGHLYDIRRDMGILSDRIADIIDTEENETIAGFETEAEAEMRAAVEELESKYKDIESDLKKLISTDKSTERLFDQMNQMFEEFKMNTMTRDEFLIGIESKADKDEIGNIVQRDEYDNGLTCLNESLNILSDKLQEHGLIENRINILASETERKISRDELSMIQIEIKDEFIKLKQLMEIKEQNDKKRKAAWAAGGVKVNCISCSKQRYQKKKAFSYGNEAFDETGDSVYAALEFKEALPSKVTIGPYRTYELDAIRKLRKAGKPVGKALSNQLIGQQYLKEQAYRARPKTGRPCGGSHTRSHYQNRPASAHPSSSERIRKAFGNVEEISLYSKNGTIYRGAK